MLLQLAAGCSVASRDDERDEEEVSGAEMGAALDRDRGVCCQVEMRAAPQQLGGS